MLRFHHAHALRAGPANCLGAALLALSDAGLTEEGEHTVPAREAEPANGELPTVEVPVPQPAIDFYHWLVTYPWIVVALGLLFLLLAATLAYGLGHRLVLPGVRSLVRRSGSLWGRILIEHNVFHRLVPVLPIIVIYFGVLLVPDLGPASTDFIQRLALVSIIVFASGSVGSLLTAINDIYARYPVARGRPIKGYLQIGKVFLYLVAAVLVVTTLMGVSPFLFLSGLGAMTAVILLIFRETLLSLVASIHLVNNDLVRVGDWIEMPEFSADGDVIDIALAAVRVRNWDMTVTTIPTHKFLEHAFKNWRTMHEIGGRRIQRSIHVDMASVRFLTDAEVYQFRRFRLLETFIDAKFNEVQQYNRHYELDTDTHATINRWQLTNVSILRYYIRQYLREHPKIHQDMLFNVRELQPTAQGLPIEVYVYTNDTLWGAYEAIQADIFDHIIAILPEFDLRLFQEPSGRDFASLLPAVHHGNGQTAEPRSA